MKIHINVLKAATTAATYVLACHGTGAILAKKMLPRHPKLAAVTSFTAVNVMAQVATGQILDYLSEDKVIEVHPVAAAKTMSRIAYQKVGKITGWDGKHPDPTEEGISKYEAWRRLGFSRHRFAAMMDQLAEDMRARMSLNADADLSDLGEEFAATIHYIPAKQVLRVLEKYSNQIDTVYSLLAGIDPDACAD